MHQVTILLSEGQLTVWVGWKGFMFMASGVINARERPCHCMVMTLRRMSCVSTTELSLILSANRKDYLPYRSLGTGVSVSPRIFTQLPRPC